MAASKEGARFMLLAVGFFSLAHASVKALSHLPFYELVFLRQLIALILCLFLLGQARISPWGNNKKLLAIRGLMGTIALACYFYTLQNMPLASAVTFQYLSPIATLFFSQTFLKEKAARKSWAYFLIAFIGVAMVKGFDARISTTAVSLAMVAVLFSALAYTSIRALKATDHELVVVLYFPLVTLPLIAPVALMDWQWPAGTDWIFVGAIGGFTFLAQLFMTKAYQRDKAEDIGIYNYLGLFVALAIGYLYFGETFQIWSLAGMALILVAVLLATQKRPWAFMAIFRR